MPDLPDAPLDTEVLRQRRDEAQRRIRRRRIVALAGLAAVIVAVGVVLAGAGGSSSPATTPNVATVPIASTTPPTRLTTAHHPSHRKLTAKPGAYERKLELAAIHRAARAHDYVIRGTPRHKLVALTFDDGPGPTTPAIFKWLRTHHVPATFFLIGANANSDPDMVRKEARAGFEIGDHTENHTPLQGLSAQTQKDQIVGGANSILAITGKHVHLFRPPEGAFDPTTLQLLKQAGLLMVLWTVDTSDYAKPGTDKIVFTALSGARAGTIILMHDGGGDRSETLAALPRIVHRLRLKGYKLVTVPRLLVSDPVPGNQPLPHSLSGG